MAELMYIGGNPRFGMDAKNCMGGGCEPQCSSSSENASSSSLEYSSSSGGAASSGSPKDTGLKQGEECNE